VTRYQLEILNPVSGQWTPHGPLARSMTAATLVGLRLDPPRDMRVVAVPEPEMMTVTARFDTEVSDLGAVTLAEIVRDVEIDGVHVLATPASPTPRSETKSRGDARK
jgi:hypothetical protein